MPRTGSKINRLAIVVAGIMSCASAWAAAPSSSELYLKHCSGCHGVRGASDRAVARSMSPPPANFTLPGALVTLNRERMMKSVGEGRPGTAMPAWKNLLTTEQIGGIVDYIRDVLMVASGANDASPGRRIFARNCSVCHGDYGNTAIWARSGLTPPPRDFTSDQASKDLSLKRLIFSITYGRPETAMPAWGGQLSQEEIEAVAEYINQAFLTTHDDKTDKTAPTPAAKEGEHIHDHFDAAAMTEPMPEGLQGDPVWGGRFYKANCALCHGEDGDGQGPRAFFIFPKPRNFLHSSSQNKFNRPHIFLTTSEGRVGTEMPAWSTVLTRQEIANVAEYVFQTFIAPGLPPVDQQPMDHHGDHAPPGGKQPPPMDHHGDHAPSGGKQPPPMDHGDHAPPGGKQPPPMDHGDHAPSGGKQPPPMDHKDHAPPGGKQPPPMDHKDHAPPSSDNHGDHAVHQH